LNEKVAKITLFVFHWKYVNARTHLTSNVIAHALFQGNCLMLLRNQFHKNKLCFLSKW